MPLTDTACKNAKPTDKARKMADGHGLYLEVMPSGARVIGGSNIGLWKKRSDLPSGSIPM